MGPRPGRVPETPQRLVCQITKEAFRTSLWTGTRREGFQNAVGPGGGGSSLSPSHRPSHEVAFFRKHDLHVRHPVSCLSPFSVVCLSFPGQSADGPGASCRPTRCQEGTTLTDFNLGTTGRLWSATPSSHGGRSQAGGQASPSAVQPSLMLKCVAPPGRTRHSGASSRPGLPYIWDSQGNPQHRSGCWWDVA